jgi:chitinase
MKTLGRLLPCLTLLACASLAFAEPPVLPRRLVADYGYWSQTQTPPYSSAQIPFYKVTQVNHAGVSFGSDGSLIVPSGFLEPALITKAHASGAKVVLLLGGDFPALEASAGILPRLISNLTSFVLTNGYDGVDIDWEYPSTTADTRAFVALFTALRTAFPAPEYLLSADVPPWGGSGYDFPAVEPLVDQFNVMMYDCAGPWTDDGQLNSAILPDPSNPEPYECEPGGSVKEAADIYLAQLHIPAAKINMGTPFYGYFYRNVSSLFGPCTPFCDNFNVPSENYGTFIKQRVNQLGWRTYYDQASLVPYMLREDGSPGYITYDDPVSTYLRISYSLWTRGLGGSFLWSMDADYDGHSQDLLDAMYRATIASPPPAASGQ